MASHIDYFESSAMNLIKTSLFVLGASTALTGCTFGPNGICGPQTPAAYCDKEAYERLVHPKPYLDFFEKQGITVEERRHDSADCGGGNSDSPGFSQSRIKSVQKSEETEQQARSRLHHEWERCMLKKGYRYTGKCYDNEISRASPVCGAP